MVDGAVAGWSGGVALAVDEDMERFLGVLLLLLKLVARIIIVCLFGKRKRGKRKREKGKRKKIGFVCSEREQKKLWFCCWSKKLRNTFFRNIDKK